MLNNITILAKLPHFLEQHSIGKHLVKAKADMFSELLCFLATALVQVSTVTSELDTIRGPDPALTQPAGGQPC